MVAVRGKSPTPAEERGRAVALFRSGLSVREVARTFDVSEATLRTWIKTIERRETGTIHPSVKLPILCRRCGEEVPVDEYRRELGRIHVRCHTKANQERPSNRASARDWKAANRDLNLAYSRKSYRKDIERSRLLGRASVAARLYTHSVSNACQRGLEWSIREDDFWRLRQEPCTYCLGHLPETGAGLDRVDNTRGYHLDNVVPCCGVCNRTRGDWLSRAEMTAISKVLVGFRQEAEASEKYWGLKRLPEPDDIAA